MDHGIFRPSRQSCPRKSATEIAALKPSVLIVEDNKAARESLRMVLETYGYEIEEFAAGEELIARGAMDNSACVILDVNLPGASGLETLARLRAMGISVPAVIVSGRATNEMRVQAARLNAVAFFEKPIDIDALAVALGAR